MSRDPRSGRSYTGMLLEAKSLASLALVLGSFTILKQSGFKDKDDTSPELLRLTRILSETRKILQEVERRILNSCQTPAPRGIETCCLWPFRELEPLPQEILETLSKIFIESGTAHVGRNPFRNGHNQSSKLHDKPQAG